MPNKQRMQEIEDYIVNLLENNKNKYYHLSDISRSIPIGKHEHKYLKNILNKLTRKGAINKRGKRFGFKTHENSSKKMLTGIFDGTSLVRGFSFAFVNHPEGDILIDSEDTGTALHNDKVRVEIKYKKRGLLYGIVRDVVERASNKFTGNVQRYKGRYLFIPDLRKAHFDFNISDPGEAKDGDKVVIKIDNWGDRSLNIRPQGKVIEILGKSGQREVEELAIFKQFDLPLDFPEKVTQEVEKVDVDISDSEISKRFDLRDLLTITIDPPTAKDYDDALSLVEVDENDMEKDNKGSDINNNKGCKYKLYVHIADVSHYVGVDSALFEEAVERGNSFYFPRRVVPMLPEMLSNKVCSLRPDEDKLTLTVITEFDKSLNIIKQSAFKSIVRSSFRLNYDEVDDYFSGKEKIVNEEVGNMLKRLLIISEKLNNKRYDKGYIPFDMPELEVEFDDEGNVSALKRSKETQSHKLVENCMLLANEYVASTLKKHTKEAVYRVHEDPDEEKFNQMLELLHYYKIRPKKRSTMQKTVQSLLLSMRSKEHHRVFDYLILRSMKKARYDVKPLGHFGLATENYTHFTSPIRRICDLTVHHLLKMHVWKESVNTDSLDHKQLVAIAENGSEREMLADSAEREAEIIYKRLYMKEKIGETYSGLVVNLSKNMITVELDEIPILGYIPLTSLKDDYYRFYSIYMELIGKKTGKVIRLMDKVVVQVDRIDFDVIFSLIKRK